MNTQTKRMHALFFHVLNMIWAFKKITMLQTYMLVATTVLVTLLDILHFSGKREGQLQSITYHSLTKKSECIQESCGK